jgi:hypothetical protein
MAQAYVGLSALSGQVSSALSAKTPAQVFAEAKPHLQGANDYALYSIIAAERTNQSVVINKQIMKIVVMQIGFAVASIGIMFIILGISDGGADGVVGWGTFKFDFKTGSTGVVVFVLGAAMATAGGVLKNEYATVPIPGFVQAVGAPTGPDPQTLSDFKQCRQFGGAVAQECFYVNFEKTNAEALK